MGELTEALGTEVSKSTAKKKVTELAALLERSNIDVDDISRVEKVSVWQGFMKDADGEAQVIDLHSISLVPKWADGPAWPVIEQGKSVKVATPAATKTGSKRSPDGYRTCVVLPDIQIGYFRGADGLEPTHDEQALSVALQIVKSANPELVVLVGDNLDLPEMSRYRCSPAWAGTMQAAIDRATQLAAELSVAAPGADIIWLAGNHEERLPNFIKDNAAAAFGLRRGLTPEDWPVLSVPYLCRFDEFGVEYKPGYPASHYWINERLRVIHGDLVGQGSTAHKYLSREKVSVIYGHIHRREWAELTREDYDGARTILAASPGCLARIDGAVPSTKQGEDLDGRPLRRTENWQQGVAVVTFEPGDGKFFYEQVPIIDGTSFWRGSLFEA